METLREESALDSRTCVPLSGSAVTLGPGVWLQVLPPEGSLFIWTSCRWVEVERLQVGGESPGSIRQ